MKTTVWWNNEEALARECEVAEEFSETETYVWVTEPNGIRVKVRTRTHWIHTDPEIPDGCPCYGWNGDERPEKPFVGYLMGHRVAQGDWQLAEGVKSAEIINVHVFDYDHIEPIKLKEPIKWDPSDNDLIAKITAIVRSSDDGIEDNGGTSRDWVREQFLPRLDDAGFAIIAIHKRPQS